MGVRKAESARTFGGRCVREGHVERERACSTARWVKGWIVRCVSDLDVLLQVQQGQLELCKFLFGHWDA